MRSTERIARQAYEQLPARDKALVMSWRDLGNSWCDSLLNSGVLSRSGRRVRPDDAARAVENERFDQTMLDRQRRMAPIDENVRMREAAEHESAHSVVAKSFGLTVKLMYTLPGGTGSCLHEVGTPFQTAAIALAGEMWIGTFRSLEFSRGPHGCAADRRMAVAALGADHVELRKADRYCHQVLKNEFATVLAMANSLERNGFYFS